VERNVSYRLLFIPEFNSYSVGLHLHFVLKIRTLISFVYFWMTLGTWKKNIVIYYQLIWCHLGKKDFSKHLSYRRAYCLSRSNLPTKWGAQTCPWTEEHPNPNAQSAIFVIFVHFYSGKVGYYIKPYTTPGSPTYSLINV